MDMFHPDFRINGFRFQGPDPSQYIYMEISVRERGEIWGVVNILSMGQDVY